MPIHTTFRISRCFPIVLLVAGIGFGKFTQLSANEVSKNDEVAVNTEVDQKQPVDFQKHILPILRQKCLACHNSTDADSELVLETPASILQGGLEGPAVVAGNSEESLLVRLVSGQEEPSMPPADNDVGAQPLTPEELGWIKKWIDEGAQGSTLQAPSRIRWRALPEQVHPIYSVAISPDGQYAAAGRGNQIFLYHIPTKRQVGELHDPSLRSDGDTKFGNNVAHRDLVHSLRFSPDNQLLVSGGYGVVKFWSRKNSQQKGVLKELATGVHALAVSSDGRWVVVGEETGQVKIYELATNELRHTLTGHTDRVSSVSFGPDGRMVATASRDQTVRMWHVEDGQSRGQRDLPTPVNAVSFVQAGAYLAAAGDDHLVHVWKVPEATTDPNAIEALEPVQTWEGHTGAITSLAGIPGTNRLLSGSADGSLRVWDLESGNQVASMDHGGPVTAVAVRTDGQRFASASSNHTAKIWSAEKAEAIAELHGDLPAQIRIQVATRAVEVADRHVKELQSELEAAKKNKEAEDKNLQTATENHEKLSAELTEKTAAAEKAMAQLAAGEQAVEAVKQRVKQADVDKTNAEQAIQAATEAIQQAEQDSRGAEQYLADVPAASKLAADALTSGISQLEEVASEQEGNQALTDLAMSLKQLIQKQLDQLQHTAEQAKTNADKALASAQKQKQTAESEKQRAEEAISQTQKDSQQKEEQQKELVTANQKANEEKEQAVGSVEEAVQVVQRKTDSVQRAAEQIQSREAEHKTHEEEQQAAQAKLETIKQEAAAAEQPVLAIAFSRDGHRVATGGQDQVVRIWDAETGVAIDRYQGHASPIRGMSFAPNGDLVSIASEPHAVVWETKPTWTLTRTLGTDKSDSVIAGRVTALGFNQDGSLLATGAGIPSRSGQLQMWKVADGTLVKEIADAHRDTVFGVAFSPDGAQLASCGADRMVLTFHADSGKQIRTFEGHTHHVLDVSWRCDGRVLATCGADNVIKVWNVRTGVQSRSIRGFDKEVTAVRFVGTSDNVAVCSGDTRVKFKNTEDGKNQADFAGPADFVHAMDVSADGSIVGAGGHESILWLWNSDGSALTTFK